ncbi:hypothetical protein Tco_1303326 [Tanacetum coccineum]
MCIIFEFHGSIEQDGYEKTKGKKLMEVEKQTTTSDVKMHDVDSITQQAKGISAIAVKSEYSLRSASNGSNVKVTSKSKPPKCRQMPKGMNVDVATEHKHTKARQAEILEHLQFRNSTDQTCNLAKPQGPFLQFSLWVVLFQKERSVIILERMDREVFKRGR